MSVGSLKDIQVFTGVMDGDSEKRMIRPGDYLYLLNGRVGITNDSNNGAVEDMEGNMEIFNPWLNIYAGTNKVIGSYQDKAGSSIIYFVYNSEGHHGIYRCFFGRNGFPNGQIEKVWQVKNPNFYDEYNKNPLNFHPDYRITGIELIGNILFWNQPNDEPKQMDIVRANETNKRRKFDFFVNKLELSNAVQYTFNLYDNNQLLISSVTHTETNNNIFDRIKSICDFINSQLNIGFIAINKGEYAEIEISSFGEYRIEVIDNASNKSRVLASNFYNDNVPGNFFYKIQAPPFCCPNAYYTPAGDPVYLDNPAAAFYNYVEYNNVGSGTSTVNFIGIFNETNDINNNITLGPTTNAGPNLFNAGYIKNLPGATQLEIQLTGLFQILQAQNQGNNNNPSGLAACQLNLRVSNANNSLAYKIPLVNWQNGFNTPTLPAPILYNWNPQSGSLTLNLTSGQKVYLELIVYRCHVRLSNFTINLGSETTASKSINRQALSFRNKYIYENFQKTVYGQATSIVLRTAAYTNQFDIKVEFPDKFIIDDNYASRIKQVVCSLTQDGGTTWYDWRILEKHEFICQNNQFVVYTSNETHSAVATSEAILMFHAVPRKALSLSYADNRLLDGGIVEGYNTIKVDYSVSTYVQNYYSNPDYYQNFPISVEGFKNGYKGKIGIVYYDDFDRKCGVCLSENAYIEIPDYPYPLYGNTPGASDKKVWGIKMKIYNEPPPWATKYRIVRTRDLAQSDYLIWVVNAVEAIDAQGNSGGPNPVYYKINFDNIPFYTDFGGRGSIIEYTFQKGDRIKILTDNTSLFLNEPLDVPILQAESNEIYVKYDPLLNINAGCIVEIYTKGSENLITEPLYYEIGECFEIKEAYFDGVLKKYHTGNDQTVTDRDQQYLFGGNTLPAQIDTKKGGVYYRNRELFYNVSNPTPSKWILWLSSNYADEVIPSKYDGLYRPNSVIDKGEVELYDAIRFSNIYIQDSKINGLNEYEPLNIVRFGSDYGKLIKLQLINNDIVRCVFDKSYQISIYINQGVIRQTQTGEPLISVTNNVINNSHNIQRTIGSQNAESIVISDASDIFGYDQKEGVVWRTSNNGVVQISDRKMKTPFKKWSETRNLYKQERSNTPSIYDIYRDLYILTLGEISNRPAVPPICVLKIQNVPKDPYSVRVFIEETNEQLIPFTVLPQGSDLISFIKVSLLIYGWLVYDNQDGSISIYAPNQSYSNLTIVAEVQTNQILYGEELVENGQFLNDPIYPLDWDYNLSHWRINSPNYVPFSGLFGTGIPYVEHFPGASNNTPFKQVKIGLETGQLYRVSYDINIIDGNVYVQLGDGPNANQGVITQVNGLNTIVQLLTFNDLPANDVVLFNTTLPFSEFGIKNISIKKVLPNNFTFKYKFSEYIPEEREPIFDPITICYSNKDDRSGWVEYASFIPELYGCLNDIIVSYKDGKMWLHTTQAIPKNYYGVQYARELVIISNKDFPKVKEYKAISINGIGKNSAPEIIIPAYEGVPNGMETELTPIHFETKEGIQYAAIQKDKLTPGFTNTDEAWVNGRSMKGQVIQIKLVNNEPIVSLIYSAEILYFYSENS